MIDVCDALVDLADRLGVPQHQVYLLVERARPVEVAHPMELGSDPEACEERDKAGRVIVGEVRSHGRIRARDRAEWLAHVLGHARALLHRLRVHRVVVVNRVDEAHVEAMRLERAEQRVADDRATKTRDRHRPRGGLRIAHHVRPARCEESCLLVGPEGRLVP
jgi:hypothetical protein